VWCVQIRRSLRLSALDRPLSVSLLAICSSAACPASRSSSNQQCLASAPAEMPRRRRDWRREQSDVLWCVGNTTGAVNRRHCSTRPIFTDSHSPDDHESQTADFHRPSCQSFLRMHAPFQWPFSRWTWVAALILHINLFLNCVSSLDRPELSELSLDWFLHLLTARECYVILNSVKTNAR